VRRLAASAVASAAVIGAGAGVVLHNALATSPKSGRPDLPSLYGQATWQAGARPAPKFALHDQRGRVVSLRTFRGRTIVLAFMDSLCTAECPLEAAQLAAAFRPMAPKARPQLVVVSVDLADTRRSVAAAARKWRLPAGFEWLSGTKAQLAHVWSAYGIDVKPTSSGDTAHSVAFYVIDRRGDERAGFLAPFLPGLLTRDLRALA
jgi:cytochrome oxidase Cu insertion factor (SCO1/SenC/PrrC family)